jgi:hypothetical protein
MNDAARVLAKRMTGRHWRATVALAVLVGVVAGLVLGLWGICRRTSSVHRRLIRAEAAAQITVFTCQEDIADPLDPACLSYDASDVTDFLRGLPGVVSVGRNTNGNATVAPADHPDRWQRQLLPIRVDADAALGRPILVAGRTANLSVATEVEVNEAFRDTTGLGVGDKVLMIPYRLDEFDLAGDGVQPPTGAAMTMTIVGVVRRHADLAAKLSGSGLYAQTSDLRVGPAWWAAVRGDVARYGLGVAIRTDGSLTKDEVLSAFRAKWPHRFVDTSDDGVVVAQGVPDASEPISLQARALEIIAGALALAAVALIGPAVVRQVRREWRDAATLKALGAGRPLLYQVTLARATTIAGPAALLAGAVAVAISPLGPVGLGRAAEVDPGPRLDATVLAVGLPVVVVAVIALALIGLRTPSGPAARTVKAPATGSHWTRTPTALAGVVMTRTRPAGGSALGSAVAGVALSAAAVTGAWSLVASYDRTVHEPARYGVTWDAAVGNVGSEAQRQRTEATLLRVPGIRAAGLTTVSEVVEGHEFVLETFRPVIGRTPEPWITAGRPPMNDHEVAVGDDTLRDLGAHIGDTIRLPPGDPNGIELDVVGIVPVNDLHVNRTGRGAYVIPDLFDRLAPGQWAQQYAVWVEPSADRESTLEALYDAFPTTYLPPIAPGATRNLQLVRGQPELLAVLLASVAAAVLIHALVLSVQGSRHQIGVLKTLGFSRRQVSTAVSWHATILGALGTAIGVPLGVIFGRVVWNRLADNLGVVAGPVVPISAAALSIPVTLLFANLVAAVPSLLAARTPAARVLRQE